MKGKRTVLHCVLMFLAVYSIAYIVEYNNCKHNVECEINEYFKESAPFFCDSIMKIANVYCYYVYDVEHINKRLDMIHICERGELRVSRDIINIENPQKYHNRILQTSTLSGILDGDEQDYCDVFIADSVWNNQLREHGYDVDAVLLLSIKDLHEMFPRRDSLATNLRAPYFSVRNLSGKEYFVTDSVGLGICNQGYIVSHVHVPVLTVLGHTKWYGTPLCVALIALLLLVAVALLRKYFTERKSATRYKAIAEALDEQNDGQSIVFGNLVYYIDDSTLYNIVSRQQLKLPRTQARIMKMLVTSEDYFVTKIEICKELWGMDEKQVTKNYNSACKRLRDSLECIDGIRLLTIKDTAIQLEVLPADGN